MNDLNKESVNALTEMCDEPVPPVDYSEAIEEARKKHVAMLERRAVFEWFPLADVASKPISGTWVDRTSKLPFKSRYTARGFEQRF